MLISIIGNYYKHGVKQGKQRNFMSHDTANS